MLKDPLKMVIVDHIAHIHIHVYIYMTNIVQNIQLILIYTVQLKLFHKQVAAHPRIVSRS